MWEKIFFCSRFCFGFEYIFCVYVFCIGVSNVVVFGWILEEVLENVTWG